MANSQKVSRKYLSEQLKEQILNLIDDLIEILPKEQDILLARIFFEFQDDEKIMKGFQKFVLPQRKYIEEKDERYFTENDYIFGDLPKDKVKHFKYLYEKENVLSTEDKNVIWQYFQLFLNICDNYKKME